MVLYKIIGDSQVLSDVLNALGRPARLFELLKTVPRLKSLVFSAFEITDMVKCKKLCNVIVSQDAKSQEEKLTVMMISEVLV